MTWDTTESTNRGEDIFKATHYKPSTESWYPGNNINFQSPEKEINDFSNNQVDEPNQQGLAHLDAGSGAVSLFIKYSYLLIFVIVPLLT